MFGTSSNVQEGMMNITEYFSENVNNSETLDEGAGLGIIMISMMLRNMGVTEEDFVIRSQNNRTMQQLKFRYAET